MISLTNIWRYPVKGLTGQALQRVTLTPRQGLPRDRLYGLARADAAELDFTSPSWARKRNFLQLVPNEILASAHCEFDADAKRLTVAGFTADLDSAEGRARIADYFGSLAGGLPQPPRLIECQVGHFTDQRTPLVSMINLASLRDLETRLGVALDPLRFRANLAVEGLEPWVEREMTNKKISIGSARFTVIENIGRCMATHVNPQTGRRDVDILAELRPDSPEMEFGIFLRVEQGGEIAQGDLAAIT